MDKETLIEENNRKQKQLNKANEKYYGDMLIYVRLSFSKSEQEMEEVLMEMLDHLLIAQEEGRSARDVFGDDPKQYAQDLIGELPQVVTKERVGMFVMGLLYFVASIAVFNVLLKTGLYFIFDLGELVQTFHTGSMIIKGIIYVPVVFFLVYILVELLRWTCFRNIHIIWEFFIYWLWFVGSVGVFMLVIWLTPEIGPAFDIPLYGVLIIGVLFYIAGRMVRKKI